MRVRQRTAVRATPQGSPDWVADWWIPVVEARPVDADLPALLVPQPSALEVVGRVSTPEPAAR